MGGEPAIRKDFVEILDFCRGLGMDTMLATNGRTFADRARLDECLAAGLGFIGFSLLHHREEAANYIARAPRTWKEQRQALININAAGREWPVRLQVRTVVSRWNYSELADMVKYVEELVTDIPFAFLFKLLREPANLPDGEAYGPHPADMVPQRPNPRKITA